MAIGCWLIALGVLLLSAPAVVVLWKWLPMEFWVVSGAFAMAQALIIIGIWLWME